MSLANQVIRTIGGNTSRGIDCTTDGVTLAGIPLLRRTPAGFAPRPAEEIGKLLSGAYGLEFSPTRVQPRLAVISKALNDGDVARAMVATVQLALPELNAGAVSRLAKVHGGLVKFDPNEPRDERGRWTSAGSGGAEGSGSEAGIGGTGGAGLIPVSNYEPANDNMPKDLREQFEEILHDPRIINHIITAGCISNIQGGDYYDKVMECKSANQDCEYLVKLGEKDFRRQDVCNYPDGATVIAKGGILIPVRMGHKW